MKNKILVYADLQREDVGQRIITLDTVGTLKDLERNNIDLSEGAIIWCWRDDGTEKLEFDPFIFPLKVSFNKEINKWVGEYKSEDLLHYSDYLEKGDHSWDDAVAQAEQ